MSRLTWLGGAALLALGCTDVESPTELNPAGPPMVRQLFLTEYYANASNVLVPRMALAFGTHPEADPAIIHPVTAAGAYRGQDIRVVMDELLVGNYLEEIACKAPVGGTTEAYSQVPVGATPDDIAACATPADVLAETCTGPMAVCLDGNGVPVGVLDNEPEGAPDGAADDTRLIDGAVGIRCVNPDSGGTIDVPLDRNLSYWQPSGNQQVPAQGGLGVLGPAVVLRTLSDRGLPTRATCEIVFSPTIVDKSGIRVCAPPGGDVTLDCVEGDTSLVSFGVESMRALGHLPQNNQMNVALTKSGQSFAEITLQMNVPLDEASFANVTLSPAPGGAITPVRSTTDPSIMVLQVAGGFASTTTYTLTIPVTATDTYGIGMSVPYTFVFTTRA